jgi:hypothetical protein
MARHNQIPCPKRCGHPQGEHYSDADPNDPGERYDCRYCSCQVHPWELTVTTGHRYHRGVGWA